MAMISYAQNHEDVLLGRVFADHEDGFYIDVGANDPVRDSVTKHFYDRGWRGINIEPQTGRYECLRSQRPDDVNLNVGLSDRETALELLECLPNDTLSTFSSELASFWREQGLKFVTRRVPVTTLARMCDEHVDRPIDFLKIDVEGHEREVIEGGDWARWRPRVVLVEASEPQRWEPQLLTAHYLFAAFDGLNRFYVRAEDSQLLAAFHAPVCFFDDFVPYTHQKIVDDLNAQLGLCKDLGPNTISIALWLRRMSTRFPRLSLTMKQMLRRGA
jgi:FkbM family methyltransferase